MAVTHFIAHSISRNGSNVPVALELRQEAMSLNGYLEELLRELKSTYIGKAGKLYGQFSSDVSDAVVSQWLREFREDKISFESFSKKACEHLQILLTASEAVIDGHIFFVAESLADGDSLYVFVVQHNEGVYLDGEQSLQTSRFIDARGVLLGARIDMTVWGSDETSSYLSVLRARGDKDLTDCFWQWIAFADERDVAAENTAFLDVVTAYSETLTEDQVPEYRHKVIDYCLDQDKKGTPIVIRDLSEHVNESAPQAFSGFLDNHHKEVPAAIIPDRRQLKQFVRISGRNDLLSMSFSSDCLGESIVYDKGSDSLTITDIPAPLKARLIKHMQQGIETATSAEDYENRND